MVAARVPPGKPSRTTMSSRRTSGGGQPLYGTSAILLQTFSNLNSFRKVVQLLVSKCDVALHKVTGRGVFHFSKIITFQIL